MTTGGLGPTVDDVTRKVVARVSQRPLVFEERLATQIQNFFKKIRKECSTSNLNQAFIPQGAQIIENPVGTAPGFIVKSGVSYIICLPGVPSEMQSMFEATVIPFLKNLQPQVSIIRSKVFRTTGISESRLNEAIFDIFSKSRNPTVGVLAHAEGVDIRLTAQAASVQEADEKIESLAKTVIGKIPLFIYGINEEKLEFVVGQLLLMHHLSIATAESCSGGLIAHRLTQIPGSSNYFHRGYVVYSNESKMDELSVDSTTLQTWGAVSKEVAGQLASQCRKNDQATLGISTSGIAGPSGGSDDKPVGTVYIGIADEHQTRAFRYQFSGSREVIKLKTSQAALELVRRYCLSLPLSGDQ